MNVLCVQVQSVKSLLRAKERAKIARRLARRPHDDRRELLDAAPPDLVGVVALREEDATAAVAMLDKVLGVQPTGRLEQL